MDLQPQNIFLTHDKKLKLGDFGMSKFFNEEYSIETKEEIIAFGSHFAPEMWILKDNKKSGKKNDGKIDVWALGVILYQLMTN